MSKDQVLEVAREDFVLDDEPFAAGAMGDPAKVLPTALADLKREIHFLSTLRHPYVLELRGVCWGNSPHAVIMLMEMCAMTLEQRVVSGYRMDGINAVALPETTKYRYALQLALALQHLVDSQCIHRDLKPANVMLSLDDQIKLVDFGLATCLGKEPREMTGETGSYRYMAPEVFSHQSAYSYPVDVYSFGMLMYYLFAGIKPFYEVGNGVECARLALRGSRPVIQAVDTFEMRSVISSCWVHEPGYRPSISKVVAELVGLLEVATVSEHHRRKSLYELVFG
ncbi:hypothetical protein BASA81_003872 [Batrachochytrium salamandrivorans]|nr:hypothetical protein BASA81_003872 [Batrachochytrium salamandrivorans]